MLGVLRVSCCEDVIESPFSGAKISLYDLGFFGEDPVSMCTPGTFDRCCRVLEAIARRINESTEEREAKRTFEIVDSSKHNKG